MTCLRARRSSKFGAIRPPTAELHVAALERREKNLYRLIMGKTVLPLFLSCFDQIIFILAVKDDIHKSLAEFKIRPDPLPDHRVTCP